MGVNDFRVYRQIQNLNLDLSIFMQKNIAFPEQAACIFDVLELGRGFMASRYVLYMPNKEQLIAQVEAVLKKRKENESEP